MRRRLPAPRPVLGGGQIVARSDAVEWDLGRDDRQDRCRPADWSAKVLTKQPASTTPSRTAGETWHLYGSTGCDQGRRPATGTASWHMLDGMAARRHRDGGDAGSAASITDRHRELWSMHWSEIQCRSDRSRPRRSGSWSKRTISPTSIQRRAVVRLLQLGTCLDDATLRVVASDGEDRPALR
jgi:hypothetical protein